MCDDFEINPAANSTSHTEQNLDHLRGSSCVQGDFENILRSTSDSRPSLGGVSVEHWWGEGVWKTNHVEGWDGGVDEHWAVVVVTDLWAGVEGGRATHLVRAVSTVTVAITVLAGADTAVVVITVGLIVVTNRNCAVHFIISSGAIQHKVTEIVIWNAVSPFTSILMVFTWPNAVNLIRSVNTVMDAITDGRVANT